MTAMAQHISDLKKAANLLKQSGQKDLLTAIEGSIDNAESLLWKEEQQLRYAYRAGQKRESSVIEGGLYEDPESVPDLDTYINQLKKEE